mgnify:CR=1 FL=1
MLQDLVRRTRSYRRFYEEPISRQTLLHLVDCARLTASGGNRQPLKYFLANEPAVNATIFEHIGWAGYLKDWPGPEAGERPSAYIIILLDKEISQSPGADHGIAAQTIMLAANELGLGGCIIATVQRDKLQQALNIPLQYEILLVLALGKPKETVVIEEITSAGDIKYWRDEAGVHHVPKRRLEDIIIN